MLPIARENILFELICFAAFISICAGLLKFRWSKKCSILILTASVAIAAVIQIIILLTASDAVGLMLTFLPITAYLPVIIAVHILAKGGFAAAVTTWSFGLLVSHILNLFRELIQRIWTMNGASSISTEIVVIGTLILGALLVFAVLRFCRKSFQMFEFQNKYVWLIVPVVLIFLLLSYFESMTFEPFIAFLTFSLALVMFIFVVKFLNIAMSERMARASEQKIAKQLDVQREELLRINQKMEQGRIYRHDMRHHLSVLNHLAETEKTEDIQTYINSLNTQISEVEKDGYCDNSVINAVLSSYIGKAKQEDIRVEAKVNIPEELPIDAFDVCTVLANALDNAVTACRNSQGERWIYISSAMHENGNFSIDIKNPSDMPVEFGRDGLPISHSGEEHGLGIKSIDAIVKKYNGILRCTCDDGVFRLSAVLFPPDSVPPSAKPFGLKNAVSNTVASLLLAVFFLNFLPQTMQAAAAIPVIGNAVRLLDIRTYSTHFSWGFSSLQTDSPRIEVYPTNADAPQDSEPALGTSDPSPSDIPLPDETTDSAPATTTSTGSVTLPQLPVTTTPAEEQPHISAPTVPAVTGEPTAPEPEAPALENPNPPTSENPDLSGGIDEMNRQMEEYIAKVKDEFLYYFERKYHGYVASDTGYTILRNDERLLSIQLYTTIGMGSSATYSRCFTLDKTSGTVLTLADLFAKDSDYIGVISADILRQMEEQVAADEADYYIPGGIWSESECFKQIKADQNFYIDENNKLVILFDEYEVAPGSAGMPKFTIEPEILQTILHPSFVLALVEGGTE